MRACPSCGSDNGDDARQCASCGRPLPPPIPTLPPRRSPSRPPPPPPAALRPEVTPSGATSTIPPVGIEDLPSAGLLPLPEVPDGGLVESTRYTIAFARARVARKKATRLLVGEIQSQVASLDSVLGLLGREIRTQGIEHRAFREESRALDAAEANREIAEKTLGDLVSRRGEEVLKYEEIQRDLSAKLSLREEEARQAEAQVGEMEARRKALRDRKRDLDKARREKLKSAEAREQQAEAEVMGDSRTALRRSADEMRREAAVLDPEREDVEKELAAGEKPHREAVQHHETVRAELVAARDALERAREGHRLRLSEIELEQGRKSTDVKLAEAEIQRRLVTLGTLANLNRVDRAALRPLYERIDQLRAGIATREGEVERLTSERDAFDRAAVIRGVAVLSTAVVALITLICLLLILL